jgi:hypothetical protein
VIDRDLGGILRLAMLQFFPFLSESKFSYFLSSQSSIVMVIIGTVLLSLLRDHMKTD